MRYAEKLATPDTAVADLIGDVDPIRVAEGRYLGDELTIHFGLVPRTNRGIVAINELPDLPERIQVALLNILEERDVQVRGYKIRLPLDLMLIASANPEDYTHRGRIITPLKDRFGSQIRTHYPQTIEDEIEIMEQEATPAPADTVPVRTPDFIAEVIAELTAQLRVSPHVNQRSGVSVRFSIGALEAAGASALRRALTNGEDEAIPRIVDLWAILPASIGRIEFDTLEEGREPDIIGRALKDALLEVWRRRIGGLDLRPLTAAFEGGLEIKTSDAMRPGELLAQVDLQALRDRARRGPLGDLGGEPRRDRVHTRVRARGVAPHPPRQQGHRRRRHSLALLWRAGSPLKSRYSRWDDTQNPLGPDLDIGRLLDEMSEDLLSGFGADWSLRNLRRIGMGDMEGLDALARRLRLARERAAERLNLSGPLAEVREKLDQILNLERDELSKREGEDARIREVMLDAMPGHPAGALPRAPEL